MIYDELKRLTWPLIEAFEDDLLKHDRQMIEQHEPGTPFLHYTRATGTHLFMLIPADEYPRKGEYVPFLFGHADREHLVQSVVDVARGFVRRLETGDTPQKLVLHFDGRKFRQVNERKAHEIARDYAGSVRAAWERAERRCDPVAC